MKGWKEKKSCQEGGSFMLVSEGCVMVTEEGSVQ
jgi:hypothetical protein